MKNAIELVTNSEYRDSDDFKKLSVLAQILSFLLKSMYICCDDIL